MRKSLSLIHIYEYDLAGFAVGVCDKKDMITGENLSAGDVLIGERESHPDSRQPPTENETAKVPYGQRYNKIGWSLFLF